MQKKQRPLSVRFEVNMKRFVGKNFVPNALLFYIINQQPINFP